MTQTNGNDSVHFPSDQVPQLTGKDHFPSESYPWTHIITQRVIFTLFLIIFLKIITTFSSLNF